MEPVSFKRLKPKVVLGVAAHPDDLEFYMGGTVAKWAEDGTQVYYLILTDGGRGTADPKLKPVDLKEVRHKEQQEAARILGVEGVTFCDYKDCCLTNTTEVRRDIARAIRKYRPDVVLTIDPSMLYSADYVQNQGFINHPDHRAAGQAVLDAVFPLARDYLSFPELEKEGLSPHKVQTILLVNFEKSNYAEDISGTIDKKAAALKAHTSQKPDVELLQNLSANCGAKCNCQHAETFVRIDIESSLSSL